MFRGRELIAALFLAALAQPPAPVESVRTSRTYQVVEPSGQPLLEIVQQTEHTKGEGERFVIETAFTLPTGARYVLRQEVGFQPPRYDESLTFPDRQVVSLTAEPPRKARDATNTKVANGLPPEGQLRFGSNKMTIRLDVESMGGVFKNKDGRDFRNGLPALPDELIEALANTKRENVCDTLHLCGVASVFFEAYRDDWLSKDSTNGWELKKIR